MRTLVLVVLFGLVGCKPHPAPWEDQIMFAQRAYFDSADRLGPDEDSEYASVYVAGTLTGDGVAYKNNSVVVSCEKARMECLTYSVEAIGDKQIGRLDTPSIFTVTKWDKNEVVAVNTAEGLLYCATDTITFDRISQAVLWVETPINQTQPKCKNAGTKILKWTFEDSPAWKTLEAATSKPST